MACVPSRKATQDTISPIPIRHVALNSKNTGELIGNVRGVKRTSKERRERKGNFVFDQKRASEGGVVKCDLSCEDTLAKLAGASVHGHSGTRRHSAPIASQTRRMSFPASPAFERAVDCTWSPSLEGEILR